MLCWCVRAVLQDSLTTLFVDCIAGWLPCWFLGYFAVGYLAGLLDTLLAGHLTSWPPFWFVTLLVT